MAYINGKKVLQVVKTQAVAVNVEANPSGTPTKNLKTLLIDDSIYSVKNDVVEYNPITDLCDINSWSRGSVMSSGGQINPITYRIYTTNVLHVTNDITIYCKEGFRSLISYYNSSNVWQSNGQLNNSPKSITSGSYIRITIARTTENTSETADYETFTNGVEYVNFALKTINVIGDSYVANNGQPVSDTWHYKYADNNNMIYNNYGINGNPLVDTTKDGNPVVSRYTQMGDADIIIVIGGKNDFNVQLPISDFETGLITLCEGLINKYIGKRIMFFTPFRASMETLIECDSDLSSYTIPLNDYIDKIIDVCNSYNIPVFDTKESQIYISNSSFRSNYMQGANDVSHLKESGHNYFLPIASKFINNNI